MVYDYVVILENVLLWRETYMKQIHCHIAFWFKNTLLCGGKLAHDNELLDKKCRMASEFIHINPCYHGVNGIASYVIIILCVNMHGWDYKVVDVPTFSNIVSTKFTHNKICI